MENMSDGDFKTSELMSWYFACYRESGRIAVLMDECIDEGHPEIVRDFLSGQVGNLVLLFCDGAPAEGIDGHGWNPSAFMRFAVANGGASIDRARFESWADALHAALYPASGDADGGAR